MTDFFSMGGYGLYVWGSYGVTALFILIELISLSRRRRTLFQRLARLTRTKRTQAGRKDETPA